MVYQFSNLDEVSSFLKKQKDLKEYFRLCRLDSVRILIKSEYKEYSINDIEKMIKEGKL